MKAIALVRKRKALYVCRLHYQLWCQVTVEAMLENGLQAEALTEIGKLQHKKRDYRKAAEQLQKAVDLRPNGLQVGRGYFHACMLLHKSWTQLLTPQKHAASAYHTGAVSTALLGSKAHELMSVDVLMSLCRHMQARTFLGLCQVSMGDIQLGASNYEHVLKQDPENLEACVYLAQARKEVSHMHMLEEHAASACCRTSHAAC